MLRAAKLWVVLLLFAMPACSDVANEGTGGATSEVATDAADAVTEEVVEPATETATSDAVPSAENEISVIASINIGTTNTRLDSATGIVDEWDMGASIRTKETDGARVQSVTIRTPSGAEFTASRDDTGEIDQIDPDHKIEVIRAFEVRGEEGVWRLAGIANKNFELFGDGTYTVTANYENGSQVIEVWYGELDSKEPLPFPQNKGFSMPDVREPMTSPITFTWETDPNAQSIGVYFAGGGPTKSEQLPATETSFGPNDFEPGTWALELAITTERQQTVDGVEITIRKGTVYSTEGVVAE